MKRKNIALNLCAALLASGLLAGCGATGECLYCGNKTNKNYKLSDGSDCFVCPDCSSECMLCGEKATKHYESYLGMVFVCNDCYKEVKALNALD